MQREINPKRIAEFIGKAIQAQRDKQGMKQEAIAEQVQISRTSISNIERGHHVPTLVVLYRICEALGIEVSEVLPRQDYVSPATKEEKQPLTQTALEKARLKAFQDKPKHDDQA